jgi:hypothetical protein
LYTKGWYLAYIDRDPAAIKRQQELKKRQREELDEEARQRKFISEQVAMAKVKPNLRCETRFSNRSFLYESFSYLRKKRPSRAGGASEITHNDFDITVSFAQGQVCFCFVSLCLRDLGFVGLSAVFPCVADLKQLQQAFSELILA